MSILQETAGKLFHYVLKPFKGDDTFIIRCPFFKILQSRIRTENSVCDIKLQYLSQQHLNLQCLYMNWRIVITIVQQFLSVAFKKLVPEKLDAKIFAFKNL